MTETRFENDAVNLSMPLIRLESSQQATPRCNGLDCQDARARWLLEHRLDLSTSRNAAARLPPGLSFAQMPFDLLLAYQQHRETSELGHVFRIANGQHDHVDALVVVGSQAECRPAQMLAQACCDPFHNELSRAARGSKPRLYFLTDPIDNDRLHSLLGRLKAGGYGDGPAEDRWALLLVGGSDRSHARTGPLLFEQLMALQEAQGDWRPTQSRPGRVTMIGDAAWLQQARLRRFGVEQHLRVPVNLGDSPLNPFCPAALLVGAFLGLDCVQYLVGAVAVTQHFVTAPATENLVCRYAAATGATSNATFRRRRLLTVPNESLVAVGRWMSAADTWWQRDREPASVVLADEEAVEDWCRDRGDGRSAANDSADAGGVHSVTHLVVDSVRTDPLPSSGDAWADLVGDPGRRTGSNRPLPEIADDDHHRLRHRLAAAGWQQQVLRLPVLDTAWLGQLLQLQLLAAGLRRFYPCRGRRG